MFMMSVTGLAAIKMSRVLVAVMMSSVLLAIMMSSVLVTIMISSVLVAMFSVTVAVVAMYGGARTTSLVLLLGRSEVPRLRGLRCLSARAGSTDFAMNSTRINGRKLS